MILPSHCARKLFAAGTRLESSTVPAGPPSCPAGTSESSRNGLIPVEGMQECLGESGELDGAEDPEKLAYRRWEKIDGGTPGIRVPRLRPEPVQAQDFCTTRLLVTENTPGTPEAFRKAKCLSDSLTTVPTSVTSPLFTMMPMAS